MTVRAQSAHPHIDSRLGLSTTVIVLAMLSALLANASASAQTAPTFQLAGATVAESDSGATSVQVQVSLSADPPLAAPVVVRLAATDGSATAGSDYNIPAGSSATFLPGEFDATRTVLLEIVGDVVVEGDESFTIFLVDAAGTPISGATAQVDITDDDFLTVGIADQQFAEGDVERPAQLAVSFSNPVAVAVQVQGSAADGTALAGADYSAPQLSVTVPALSLSGSFDLSILGDTLYELDETFTVNLTSTSVGTVGQGQAVVTLIDDDPLPTISVSSTSTVEGDAGSTVVQVPVHLSNPSAFPVQVRVDTADGSATSGVDFTPISGGSVTIAPGSTSATVGVSVLGDTVIEPSESFVVQLSQPQGASLGTASASVTVLDDDALISLANSIVDATESTPPSQLELVISRTGDLSQTLDLDISYGGTATPDADFVAGPSSVTLPANADSVSVFLDVIDDSQVEPTEVILVTVSLSPSSGPTPSSTALGLPQQIALRIHDDDVAQATVRFSGVRQQVYEDEGSFTLVVERDGDTSGSARVEVFVLGGTAREGSDFTFQTKQLDWPAGDASPRTLDVDLIEHPAPEGTEQAIFQLRNPSSQGGETALTLGDPAASVVEILERSGATFVNRRLFVQEGTMQIPLEVRRLGDTSGPLSVEVCIDGGTSSASDRTVTGRTLSWPANDATTRAASLDVIDDLELEPRETLLLRLCNATSGNVTSTMTVYLLDNDVEEVPDFEFFPEEGPENPAVAYGRSGQRVVVWQQNDGDGFGIWGRFIGSDGERIGQDFQVNSNMVGDQTEPDVALDFDGNFIVVWRDGPLAAGRPSHGSRSGAGSAVVGRFFDPTAQPTTGEVVVAEAGDGDSNSPNVSASNTGDAVVTWEDQGEVRGRIYTQAAQPRTGRLSLSDPLEGRAARPRSTIAASGDFVVVWRQAAQAKGATAGTIVGRIFAETGQPKSEKVIVSSEATADQPVVAADDQGNFVVAWEQEGASSLDVLARDFDRFGRARGPAFVASSSTAGSQSAPAVDRNAIGDFVVVWEADTFAAKAAGGALVGRFFDPTGSPQSGDVEVAVTENGSQPTQADVGMADRDQTTVVFEREGPGGLKEGIFSKTLDPTPSGEPCQTSPTTSCLNNSRFSVDAGWQDFDQNNGDGQAMQLTDDTNYFWFFDPANVEVVVKVLDGCAVNGHFWIFAAGLTDTEVNLRVNDSVSGETVTLFNPLGRGFPPVLDTQAFATCDAAAPKPDESRWAALERLSAEIASASRHLSAQSLAACESTGEVACLNQDRFAVSVDWSTSQGTSGEGQQVTLTTDTGYFWFFEPDNVEVVVKVIDACEEFGKYWVFAAGLTDVETDLLVVDSQTNASRSYVSELGQPFSVILDTQSFNCE